MRNADGGCADRVHHARVIISDLCKGTYLVTVEAGDQSSNSKMTGGSKKDISCGEVYDRCIDIKVSAIEKDSVPSDKNSNPSNHPSAATKPTKSKDKALVKNLLSHKRACVPSQIDSFCKTYGSSNRLLSDYNTSCLEWKHSLNEYCSAIKSYRRGEDDQKLIAANRRAMEKKKAYDAASSSMQAGAAAIIRGARSPQSSSRSSYAPAQTKLCCDSGGHCYRAIRCVGEPN